MNTRNRIELRISQFLVGNTYDPRTGNQVPLEIKRDATGTDEPDGDVFLGDVEFVVSVPATFNISTLARVISEELSVSENKIKPEDCTEQFSHGKPFRYCGTCSWTEDLEAPKPEPGRHPGTAHLLSLFEYKHLPHHLQGVSANFNTLANDLVQRLQDGPELTTGLRKLLEAKDCMVRQAVIDARTAS